MLVILTIKRVIRSVTTCRDVARPSTDVLRGLGAWGNRKQNVPTRNENVTESKR